MTNEDYRKAIWNLVDTGRGITDPRNTLDIITTVATCALLNQERFTHIKNMGANSIIPALNEVIFELSKKHKTAFKYCTEINILPESVITRIVYSIASFENLAAFGPAIRELLIEHAGKHGEFGSTAYMEKLVTTLVDDASQKTLLDAACGLARTSSLIDAKQTCLQEINLTSASLSNRLLLLEGKNLEILTGNSLSEFRFEGKKFDLVVMEPPLALRLDTDLRAELQDSPFIITEEGKSIPTSAGDAIWMQFALHQLNETGKAYLVLPQGCLFRGGYDAAVREHLLNHELVDYIVALPSGSLNGTGIEPVLLVLDKAKVKGSPIRFIDIRVIGHKNKFHVELSESDLEEISGLVNGDIEDESKAKSVTIREIRQTETDNTGNNLNISKYVYVDEVIEIPNMAEQLKKLTQSQQYFEQTQQELLTLLNQ
jgi:type I restriction enzyme M protein